MRKKLLTALVCVLLLVAAMAPAARLLTKTLAHQQAQSDELLAMHVKHAAHMEAGRGEVILPMIDIEEAWAIEDTRTEAEAPLVTEMYSESGALGFDSAYLTYYCTIGMDSEEWPEITLTAKGAEGVRVAWIDDYTYDWRTDALREGYSYELIAYTQTEYQYIYVVFTGLPIVTLHAETDIGSEYVPCRATVTGAGYEEIDSAALTHTRGGGFYKGIDKESYRVEFHGVSNSGKDKKTPVSVLGMQADTDWLLVSNAGDETAMRNELCFDMWRRWNGDGHTIMALDSRMVEVFVDDEYMGLYQLMPRVRAEDEITAMGGSLKTDIAARMIGERYETGKPLFNAHELIDGVIELRYAPQGVSSKKAFERYQPYIQMNLPVENPDYLSDAEFTELALTYCDVRETMSYYLFMQAATMTLDNVKNNLYIWTIEEDGGYRYRFSPWDMDSCLKPLFSDDTSMFNFLWPIAMRMLDNNVMNARQVAQDMWLEKRSGLLSEDALYQWFLTQEEEINASGAYLRESERWRGGADYLNLSEFSAFVIDHMNSVERILFDTWPLDVPAVYADGAGE